MYINAKCFWWNGFTISKTTAHTHQTDERKKSSINLSDYIRERDSTAAAYSPHMIIKLIYDRTSRANTFIYIVNASIILVVYDRQNYIILTAWASLNNVFVMCSIRYVVYVLWQVHCSSRILAIYEPWYLPRYTCADLRQTYEYYLRLRFLTAMVALRGSTKEILLQLLATKYYQRKNHFPFVYLFAYI